jgi:hypothetical protein
MGMQHQGHRRAGGLLALIAGLDAAGGTGKDYVGHGLQEWRVRGFGIAGKSDFGSKMSIQSRLFSGIYTKSRQSAANT